VIREGDRETCSWIVIREALINVGSFILVELVRLVEVQRVSGQGSGSSGQRQKGKGGRLEVKIVARGRGPCSWIVIRGTRI